MKPVTPCLAVWAFATLLVAAFAQGVGVQAVAADFSGLIESQFDGARRADKDKPGCTYTAMTRLESFRYRSESRRE